MELTSGVLKKNIEALLFVTKKPLTEEEISRSLSVPEEEIKKAIDELIIEYQDKGIKILAVAHGYIFGTNPECGDIINNFLNTKIETTLSPQAMEALAVIAYKQPITRLEIERIRGLYSDGVIATLLDRGVIEEKGRANSLGRPILYGTTDKFLSHFGLKNLADLPELDEDKLAQSKVFEVALK